MANGRHYLGRGEVVRAHGRQFESRQGESTKEDIGDTGWYQGILNIGAVRDTGRDVD